MADDDYTLGELARGLARLDGDVRHLAQHTITDTYYQENQRAAGERVGKLEQRTTKVEADQVAMERAREKEYRQRVWAVVLAALSLLSALSLKLLDLIAQ